MAIFRHPDGSYRRYPPSAAPTTAPPAEDEYTNPANWRPMPGGRHGIEIHRDGKTMRNTAPTPSALKPPTRGFDRYPFLNCLKGKP